MASSSSATPWVPNDVATTVPETTETPTKIGEQKQKKRKRLNPCMKRTCIHPNQWYEGTFFVDDNGALQIHIMHVSVDNYGNYYNTEDEVTVDTKHTESLQNKLWWAWEYWKEGVDLYIALSGSTCLLKWQPSTKAYDIASLVLLP